MKVICEYADFVRDYPRDPLGMFHAYAHHRFQPRQDGFIGTKLDTVIETLKAEQEERTAVRKPPA